MEIGAFEAKTRFSRLLERAAKGERIVITKHGKPVVDLVPHQTAGDMKQMIEDMFRGAQRTHVGSLKGARFEIRGTTVKSVVIDCSVAMSWCFEDEQDEAASALARQIPDIHFFVPLIWPLEVANVLAMAERRGRIQSSESDAFLRRLAAFPIEIDMEGTAQVFVEVLDIARHNRLTAYDASYIELAARRKLPLATLDRDLAAAAKKQRITLGLL